MKILRPIGAIVTWIIVTYIVSFIVTKCLYWLVGAFNTSTTFGSIIFLIITMPVVASINWWICLMIGTLFLQTKTQALVVLLVCSTAQIMSLLSNLTNITSWVITLSTIVAFGIVYFGKIKETDNGESN